MAQFCVVIYNECFLLSVTVCSKLSPIFIHQTRCTKATTRLRSRSTYVLGVFQLRKSW